MPRIIPRGTPGRAATTGASSSSSLLSSLELRATKVYEVSIRAFIETASQFCEVVALKSRTVTLVQEVLGSIPGGGALLADQIRIPRKALREGIAKVKF